MMQSEGIDKLYAAYVKAQSQVEGATKNSDNSYFNNKYADLGNVIEACRKALSDNGLAVHQGIRQTTDGAVLVTRILHTSGQWMEDDGIPLINGKKDMQGLGSAITYARRYGLMAAIGIAPEDDDGNAAAANNFTKQTMPNQMPAKNKFDAWRASLIERVAACKLQGDLDAMMAKEEKALNKCLEKFPSSYASILAATLMHRVGLCNELEELDILEESEVGSIKFLLDQFPEEHIKLMNAMAERAKQIKEQATSH